MTAIGDANPHRPAAPGQQFKGSKSFARGLVPEFRLFEYAWMNDRHNQIIETPAPSLPKRPVRECLAKAPAGSFRMAA